MLAACVKISKRSTKKLLPSEDRNLTSLLRSEHKLLREHQNTEVPTGSENNTILKTKLNI